jgi:hypothetical protein
MRLETKAHVGRFTLSLLVAVTWLFCLGVIVLVLCTGFGINPFRETTTSFLLAAFAGLIGAAAVLVLLNVATNLSLIADAKIAELSIATRPGALKKWMIGFGLAVAILVGLIFGGTYLSKRRFLAVVHAQADDVLSANKSLLEEISRRLASGEPEDYKRIVEIRNFLQNQRSGLPNLTVIYSGKFGDKLAFYKLNEYLPYTVNGSLAPTYFTCTQDIDCDYLAKFFSGEKVGVLQKSSLRDDQFYIYVPYVGSDARFVLLFDRANYYGKIGS